MLLYDAAETVSTSELPRPDLPRQSPRLSSPMAPQRASASLLTLHLPLLNVVQRPFATIHFDEGIELSW